MMNRSGIETYELLRLDEVALAGYFDLEDTRFEEWYEKVAIGREGSKQLEAARNREGLENFDGRDFR